MPSKCTTNSHLCSDRLANSVESLRWIDTCCKITETEGHDGIAYFLRANKVCMRLKEVAIIIIIIN